MKSVIAALRMLVVLTLITGVAYPGLMLMTGRSFFPYQAGGSLLVRDGAVAGSALIAQKFESAGYFHPRPSAVDYATVASGASNLSPASKALREAVAERMADGETARGGREMLFTSGSGLDPHISLASVMAQVPRVAAARGLNVDLVAELARREVTPRDLGFLGEERVNVLRLNLALDALEFSKQVGLAHRTHNK